MNETQSQAQRSASGSAGKKPALIAYTVKEIPEQDAILTRIGAACSHKSGRGFWIQLDAFPMDGRVVLSETADARASGPSR